LILNHVTRVNADAARPIDVTKLAFSAVAGVGGVVALVVAYRRQRDIEQGRFVERFGAAAAQLGASDVAVRIAGVYAMAGVADEATGVRRQQCIDVLCGYLRLPYSSNLGANHQTKHVEKRTGTDRGPDTEDHFEYRQNDKVVRQTIVRVIAEHLERDAEYNWSINHFDFRTAQFEDANFFRAVFSQATRFDEATFYGEAVFNEATFSGDATFDKTKFCDIAMFRRTRVSRGSWFAGAEFAARVWFNEAMFCGYAVFNEAKFCDVFFDDADFRGGSAFHGTRISGDGVLPESAS
jgi:hypothetical protein